MIFPAYVDLFVVVVVVDVSHLPRFAGQQMLPESDVPEVPVELGTGLGAVLHVDPVVSVVPETLDAQINVGGLEVAR